MKVYRFDQAGSLDHLTLHDEPTPEPQRGEVLIRVRASSLNYRDIAMVHGKYVGTQKAGLIPLSDAAGEIIAVGKEVTDFKVGDRVINTFHSRWYGGNPPATLGSESYGSHRDGLADRIQGCQPGSGGRGSAASFVRGGGNTALRGADRMDVAIGIASTASRTNGVGPRAAAASPYSQSSWPNCSARG